MERRLCPQCEGFGLTPSKREFLRSSTSSSDSEEEASSVSMDMVTCQHCEGLGMVVLLRLRRDEQPHLVQQPQS